MKTAVCQRRAVEQAWDATSFHVELSYLMAAGINESRALFGVWSSALQEWHRLKPPSEERDAARLIGYQGITQLSISIPPSLYYLILFLFFSPWSYLIIFFSRSLSIFPPSSLSFKLLPAVINGLLPGMA